MSVSYYTRRDAERYADRLAGYIKDVSKIEVLTRREYGYSPPRAMLADYIGRREGPKRCAWESKQIMRRPDKNDGDEFRVRGLVKQSRPQTASNPAPQIEPKPFTPPPAADALTPVDYLVRDVAEACCVTVQDIMGPLRTRRVTHARAIIIRILRENKPSIWSFPKIGKFLGGRDHSTVINAWKNWDVYIRLCPEIESVYLRFRHY